jgi:hypothetical protein
MMSDRDLIWYGGVFLGGLLVSFTKQEWYTVVLWLPVWLLFEVGEEIVKKFIRRSHYK